ncbi:MAG: WG repeat-containing protein [Flavobacteriales bacterium]
MRKILLLCFGFLLLLGSKAQNTKGYQGKKTYKFGLINTITKDTITQPIYNKIFGFNGQLKQAKVLKDNYYGVVNENGEEIIPCIYEKIELNSNWSYTARHGDSVTVYKTNKEKAFTIKAKSFRHKYHNVYIFGNGEGMGYMHLNQKEILPPKYKMGYNQEVYYPLPFTQEIAGEKLYGLVDTLGRIIAKPQFSRLKPISTGAGCFEVKKGERTYIINRFGKEIKHKANERIGRFANGTNLLEVVTFLDDKKKKYKMGALNAEGESIVPVIYDKLYPSEEKNKIFAYTKNNKIGADELKLLNWNGSLNYTRSGLLSVQFVNNMLIVKVKDDLVSDAYYMLLNAKTKKRITSIKYKALFYYSKDVIAFKTRNQTDHSYSIMNDKGMVNPKLKFDLITWKSPNEYNVKQMHHKRLIQTFKGKVDEQGRARTGKYGLMNQKGEIVIPNRYDVMKGYAYGVCKVGVLVGTRPNGKTIYEYGLLDKDGQVVLPVKYHYITEATNFSWKKPKVIRTKRFNNPMESDEGKWGLYNIENGLEIPAQYDYIGEIDNLTPVFMGELGEYNRPEKGKYGMVNVYIKHAYSKIKYDYIEKAKGNTLVFIGELEDDKKPKKGKYGMIDESGEEILPVVYDYLSTYRTHYGSTGDYRILFKGKTTGHGSPKYGLGKYWYVTPTGKKISPESLGGGMDFIGHFHPQNHKDVFRLQIHHQLNDSLVKTQYGLVTRDGEIVLPFEYDAMGLVRQDGLILVGKIKDNNMVYGVVNLSGHIIIPLEYNHIDLDNKIGQAVKVLHGELSDRLKPKVGKYGYVTLDGKRIVEPVYEAIYDWYSRRALVVKNGKYGYINEKGEEVIPCIYDGGKRFVSGKAEVMLNGETTFIDVLGNKFEKK